MKKLLIILFFLLVCLAPNQAQQKYWIYLKDKIDDPSCQKNYISGKISALIIDSLECYGVSPIVKSNWLNAISSQLNEKQISEIHELGFVSRIQKLNQNLRVTSTNLSNENLSKALGQIKADTLIMLGLTGKDVKIGIIDAGFLRADSDSYLKEIIENGQIKGYRNYIEPDITDPYGGNNSINDHHGTSVFRAIAGTMNNNYIGLANGAQYYLARTDQSDKEYRGEEDYWVAALEWMYDQGVRLINSSLGYSDGFDNPKENYEPHDIDGNSSAITKAVNIAVKEKGMTIVLSAGNDGNNKFEVISIPADAEDAITVGATGINHWGKQGYSSIGPEPLASIKPEVACYATDGTSFSAPIITGLIACMMEYNPSLTNDQIKELLNKSSHLYPFSNNYLGFGVPNAEKIMALMKDPSLHFGNSKEVEVHSKNSYIITLPKNDNIMAFHKKNKTIVLEQEKLKWKDNAVTVNRILNAAYTTVATEDHVWEIHWVD
ncbi:MAG TPA: S8 family serine peptidase [Fulvivirga sp.]|nr:S8 family serine peptidase [Fulvivirga sp.]